MPQSAEAYLEEEMPSAEVFLGQAPSAEAFLEEAQVDGRVAEMASATRHTVGVIGRAVAASDIAISNKPIDGVRVWERGKQVWYPSREAASAALSGQMERAKTAASEFQAKSIINLPSADLGIAGPSQANAPAGLQVAAGAYNAIKAVPEFFGTELGAGLIASGNLPAVAHRLIAAGFTVDLAIHTPEQIMALAKAVQSGDKQAIGETATSLGLNLGFIGLSAKTALTRVAPLTANAVAETGHAPRQEVPGTLTPLTSAAVEAVREPVATPAPTPAAVTGESGPKPAPVPAGVEPPARDSVTPEVTIAKPEGERTLTNEPEIIGMGGAIPAEFEPGRGTATGIKNAQVDIERQARGQPPLLRGQRIGNEVVWDRTMARIDTEPGWQDRLIDELKDKPRTPSADEIVALDHRYVDLQNEYAKATRDGAQHYRDNYAEGVADAKARTDFIEGKLAELEQVARNVGAEWGRSGQMRQRLMNEDFTLAAMEARERASKGFEPLTEAEHTEIADLHKKLAEAEKKATETQAASNEQNATQETDKAIKEARTTKKTKRDPADIPGRITDVTASIKTKAAQGEGSPIHSDVRKLVRLLVEQNPAITRDALIDAVHGILKESMPEITRLEAMDAISGRGRFWTPDQSAVAKQVRDLSTQIRFVAHQIDVEAGRPMPRTGYQPDKLTEAASLEKRKLNDLMRKYGVVVTDPARQLGAMLSALKTRLEREKSDLTRRLAEGDFSPRRKNRELPLDPATAASKAEVTLLRETFKKRLEKHKYELKSKTEKIWLGAKEALNLSRAMLTSWDVSAVFRQGGFIAFGNPVRAARALGPMFGALRSEKRATAIEEQIKARQNAPLYAKSKLFLAPREGGKLTGMEEAFMSRLASRIPGVAGSQRAYITFLNKLRADTFDSLHESLISKREATPEELSAIANYINVATGRGNLGKVAGAAETLSTVFFSPRLVASRFQLIFGEPLYRGSAQTRFLVAREYGKFMVGLATVYGIGTLAGATIETNPRSSDFGKLKFGNTRVDPLGGLAQTSVLVSRLATGEKTTLKGKTEAIRGKVPFGKDTAADVIATFLRTKLSPVMGSGVDVLTGENVVGEPVTTGSVAANAVVPLAFRDILDVMEEQGIPEGTALGILSLFGMGVQNYSTRK